MKIPGAAEMRASVLDCGSPLPLSRREPMVEKRQWTAAVQDLTELFDGHSEFGLRLHQSAFATKTAAPLMIERRLSRNSSHPHK
jgi:hypothetical protein